MHSNPIEALRHQLATLCDAAQKGVICLSTPCQVNDMMGWLNMQSVYPRLYWQSRDVGAVEYATLGAVNTFESLAALKADLVALDDIGGHQPDFLAAWPSTLARQDGRTSQPAAFCCRVLSLNVTKEARRCH
ncbi:hypothetical protein HORIV_62730 [Vreelandella olivaria]|uniref:Uncharacterized protein n=1 Tax=Vreelandella olivaria TaxID=390919 RepID=A0ABN5XB94_9GAMM|nr:hypothetical protein HORIV_62730 [Halomonas olivaria]